MFPREDGYGLYKSYFACAGLEIVIVQNNFLETSFWRIFKCGINLKKSNPTSNVSTNMIIEMSNTIKIHSMCACKYLCQNYIPVKRTGLYLNYEAGVLLYKHVHNFLIHYLTLRKQMKNQKMVSEYHQLKSSIKESFWQWSLSFCNNVTILIF